MLVLIITAVTSVFLFFFLFILNFCVCFFFLNSAEWSNKSFAVADRFPRFFQLGCILRDSREMLSYSLCKQTWRARSKLGCARGEVLSHCSHGVTFSFYLSQEADQTNLVTFEISNNLVPPVAQSPPYVLNTDWTKRIIRKQLWAAAIIRTTSRWCVEVSESATGY